MLVNKIVLCRDNYNSQEEFEEALSHITWLLLKAKYQLTIWWEEEGLQIVVIQFETSIDEYGEMRPVWLTPEEEEKIYLDRQN